MLKWRIVGDIIDGFVDLEKVYMVTRVNCKWVGFSVRNLEQGYLVTPKDTSLEVMRAIEVLHHAGK